MNSNKAQKAKYYAAAALLCDCYFVFVVSVRAD